MDESIVQYNQRTDIRPIYNLYCVCDVSTIYNCSRNKRESPNSSLDGRSDRLCKTEMLRSEEYICTNYNAFMTDEPCMMCAMGLLHSRIKRIFFARLNPTNGALVSRCRLHSFEGINHRYEVFHVDKKNNL